MGKKEPAESHARHSLNPSPRQAENLLRTPANFLFILPCVSNDFSTPCEEDQSCLSRYEQLSGHWPRRRCLAARQTPIKFPAVRAQLHGTSPQTLCQTIQSSVQKIRQIFRLHRLWNGGTNTGLYMCPCFLLAGRASISATLEE